MLCLLLAAYLVHAHLTMKIFQRKPMKTLCTFFLCWWLTTAALAQRTVTPDYVLDYRFWSMTDSVARENCFVFDYELIKSGTEARFIEVNENYNDSISATWETAHPDAWLNKTQEEVQANFDEAFAYLNQHKKDVTIGTFVVLKEYADNKALVKYSIDYSGEYMKVPLTFSWALHPGQTEEIAGYNCSLATTEYGGRTYQAWYTTEVPISDGPYVFAGLPGLIVRIQDGEEWLYRFELTNIDLASGPRYFDKWGWEFQDGPELSRRDFVRKARKEHASPKLFPGATPEMFLRAKEANKQALYYLLESY